MVKLYAFPSLFALTLIISSALAQSGTGVRILRQRDLDQESSFDLVARGPGGANLAKEAMLRNAKAIDRDGYEEATLMKMAKAYSNGPGPQRVSVARTPWRAPNAAQKAPRKPFPQAQQGSLIDQYQLKNPPKPLEFYIQEAPKDVPKFQLTDSDPSKPVEKTPQNVPKFQLTDPGAPKPVAKTLQNVPKYQLTDH